jgi:hypothetical protein
MEYINTGLIIMWVYAVSFPIHSTFAALVLFYIGRYLGRAGW